LSTQHFGVDSTEQGRWSSIQVRRVRHLAVILAAVLSLSALFAGCSGGERRTTPKTDLSVTITRGVVHSAPNVLTMGVYRFRLRCSDGGVAIGHQVCQTLDSTPSMLIAPRKHRDCLGGFPSPPSVTVTGKFRGDSVSLREGGCDSAATVIRFVSQWMTAFQCTPNGIPSPEQCAGVLPSPG
jgi:hypothetical protein